MIEIGSHVRVLENEQYRDLIDFEGTVTSIEGSGLIWVHFETLPDNDPPDGLLCFYDDEIKTIEK